MIDIKYAHLRATGIADEGCFVGREISGRSQCHTLHPLTAWVDLMQRYFFNVYNGTGLTEDLEGLELPGLEAARTQALIGIRSIVGEEVGSGLVDLNGRLDICDGGGSVLLSVPFSDAVEFRTPDKEEG